MCGAGGCDGVSKTRIITVTVTILIIIIIIVILSRNLIMIYEYGPEKRRGGGRNAYDCMLVETVHARVYGPTHYV